VVGVVGGRRVVIGVWTGGRRSLLLVGPRRGLGRRGSGPGTVVLVLTLCDGGQVLEKVVGGKLDEGWLGRYWSTSWNGEVSAL
jgi:hypothetical protein